MPRYRVPLTWEVYGQAIVEAKSPEEAIQKAEAEGFVLPVIDGNVDGSIDVDYAIFEEVNDVVLQEEPEGY